MMGYRKYVDRVGTVAVAVVLAATVVPAPDPTLSQGVRLSAASTALIMGGTSVPTPDQAYIDTVVDQYIRPTHGNQTIGPVSVTTPEEGWPATGLLRLSGLLFGSQSVWGPGGPGWPDQPWWKLTGLFDLSYEQSVTAGVAALETAMAEYGPGPVLIYGYSQGAMIAVREKMKLAEQYPAATTDDGPNVEFVLSGDLNIPNGGILARFPGVTIPGLEIVFNGPEPTNTQFHTTVITRQYDGLADFPLYTDNLIADVNAILGMFYVHLNDLDVSLAPDPAKSAASLTTHDDTDYYFFETQDLPLFGPLRSLGVPEGLIDIVEPFFRVLVELGYDRTIQPWVPSPALPSPPLDLGKVGADLIGAIGEGIDNAFALFGPPTPMPMKELEPARSSPPATETAEEDAAPVAAPVNTVIESGDAVSTTEAAEAPELDVPSVPARTATDSTEAVSTTEVTETAEVDIDSEVAPTETADETTPVVATDPSAQQESTTQTPGGQPADDESVTGNDGPSAADDERDGTPKTGSTSNPAPDASTPKGTGKQDSSTDTTDHECD